jgi:aminotransferase
MADRILELPNTGLQGYFDAALNDPGVVSLGVGEPDFQTPEFISDAAVASLNHGTTKYTLLRGMPALRAAVARHLKKLYDLSYDPNKEILVTVGSSEGLHAALTALINPGDEVLVLQPSYLSYVPLLRLTGGMPIAVPLRAENRFQPVAQEIKEAITPRTRAIMLNYPNNPTGAVLDHEGGLEVANLAQRHDLIVISDEIYDRFVYRGNHLSVATLSGMRERTLLLGGFSKAYAMTGWRVGYAAGPAELIGAMLQVHQYTVMCAPAMAQVAALYAIEAGEGWVDQMRLEYDRRRRLMVTALHTLGLECCEPQGAFFVFPSVRKFGLSDPVFAQRLLTEERVLVLPGSSFGAAGSGFIRCSYSASPQIVGEALARMARFIVRLGSR